MRQLSDVWPDLVDAGVQWHLRGMRMVDGDIATRLDEVVWDYPLGVPDLDDYATQGCLLGEMRRLAGCPHLSVVFNSDEDPGHWGIWYDYGDYDDSWIGLSAVRAPTEGEALIAALCHLTGVSR